jgi:DNA-binding CsgD family transcriptional regulator
MSPSKALRGLLDRISCGAVLLDGKERLVGFNVTARAHLRMMREPQGDQMGNESWALALLQQIDQRAHRCRGLPMAARRISKPDRRAPSTRMWCIPQVEDGGSKPVLILVDVERAAGRSTHLFGQLFRLTKAEVKLAARLADGHSLDAIAGELTIGIETARSQLRSVFAKTRTRRQAELVALLGRVALLQAHGILDGDELGGVRSKASGFDRFSAA